MLAQNAMTSAEYVSCSQFRNHGGVESTGISDDDFHRVRSVPKGNREAKISLNGIASSLSGIFALSLRAMYDLTPVEWPLTRRRGNLDWDGQSRLWWTGNAGHSDHGTSFPARESTGAILPMLILADIFAVHTYREARQGESRLEDDSSRSRRNHLRLVADAAYPDPEHSAVHWLAHARAGPAGPGQKFAPGGRILPSSILGLRGLSDGSPVPRRCSPTLPGR